MLRFKPRITVYRKDEETNRRELEFPFTPNQAKSIETELMIMLHGVHLVDEDGNVYVLGVNNIEQLS